MVDQIKKENKKRSKIIFLQNYIYSTALHIVTSSHRQRVKIDLQVKDLSFQ